MIVKNESAVLARCLSCVKKFADEIIVVDTGSTDNTKKIARQFTDKIFDFKWVDDFALARNFSFSKATCDYQMWLDADDVITDENIEKINQLKNSNAKADIFMFKYVFGELEYYRERLLKRNKNFVWEGIVHEVITPAGEIKYCDIEITHKKEIAGDPQRNLKIYQKAISNGKLLNARELYYYSRELFYNNKISECIKNLKKFLKIENTYPPDNLGAYLILAESYKTKNKPEKELDILFEAIKKHQPNPEICCKIGYAFKRQNKFNQSIFWFKNALSAEKQTSGFIQKDYQDIIPLLELTYLCYQQKFYSEALFFHSEAKAIRPDHPSVIYNDLFFKNKKI